MPAQTRLAPTCLFQHLNASVAVDAANHRMDVRIRVSLVTSMETSSLIIRLNPAMEVTRMADESYGDLSFRRGFWYYYNISLGRSLPAGTPLNLSLEYGGQVLTLAGDGASYWDYIGPEGSWVRTYGVYFPYDVAWTRTSSRVSITVPQGEMAIAAGALAGQFPDPANGTVAYVWENSQPVSGISFVVGRFDHFTYASGEYRYDLYFRQEHAGSAAAYAPEMARITGFYASLLGLPGFRNLTVVEVPNAFAAQGQSLPSMLWLASSNFDTPLPYYLLSHEVGHQWWGIDLEGSGAGENWLQEGFAGYSEAMYEMAAYGSREYLDRNCRQRYITQFVNGPGPEPSLASNDYDLASMKGPWVLHMLRYIVGDETFNRTLSAFHRDFFGRQVDIEDFELWANVTSGRDLKDFFRSWLFTSGRLDYALGDARLLEGENGLSRVEVRVENRGLMVGMPLDIGLYYEGGQRVFLPAAWNGSGPEAALSYDVDFPVDAVRLDPRNWLLDVQSSNNEAPTRPAFWDFRVDGLQAHPAEPEEGENFTLTVNLSADSSEGPREVGVRLWVDGLPQANASIRLGPGLPGSLNFSLALPAGIHELKAGVDPEGTFYERSESNNLRSSSVLVRPPPPRLPNPRVLEWGIGVSPPDAVGGEAAGLTALVENSGEATVAGLTVDFWVDSLAIGYAGRSEGLTLLPGERGEASIVWTALAGRHEVTARVNLPEGTDQTDAADDIASAQVYVNAPPVALLYATPREIPAGDWVEFSGNQSTDDERVTHYLFDFGDGEDTGWLADPTTSHSYPVKGSYEVRLKVEDDSGTESDWSPPFTIKVRDVAPAALFKVWPHAGDVFTTFNFTSLSSDPDGTVTEELWDFGDGTSARGRSVSHRYARHGEFRATLTVRDDGAQTSQCSVQVRIRDLPPTPAIAFESTSVEVGQRVNFSARGSSDPDDPLSRLSFLWDFGGGQKAAGIDVSYIFPRPGTYRVVLAVSDGNSSAELALVVEARPPPGIPQARQAAWQSWALLAVLLALMGLLVAYIMFPPVRRRSEEEE